MWLIHVRNYHLEEFVGSDIPPYAILSHTWGKREVPFQQMRSGEFQPNARPRDENKKILYTCKQAIKDGLEYVWIDTCCIDKSSSAEPSEAINSMFQWYERAKVCYAYLSDVHDTCYTEAGSLEFRRSRWFTRGWTLQELLAPRKVRFYTSGWSLIGRASDLYPAIEEATGIREEYLRKDAEGRPLFRSASIAAKISWASKRETTRPEDIAYYLLGILT